MILSSVFITLLLLRSNHIPLYQSLNFVLSPLNHPGSGIIFFGIIAYPLSFIIAGAGAADIFLSDHLYVSSKTLFVICKDPSLFDNTLILFVYLKLVLVLLIAYATYVLFFVQW